MKRGVFLLFFYVISLVLANILFLSCFTSKTEYEKLREEYSIYISPMNIPPLIRKGLPYKVGVKIYLFDPSLNWSLCLASFRSLAYNVTGKICTNKEEEGVNNIYEIELPKEGYIFLENLDYIISDQENILVNFCYNYYSLIGLEGCFYKNRICELKVTSSYPVDGIIKISKAESYYNETDRIFYLRLYISVETPNEMYPQPFQPVEKECFMKEYLDRFKSKYEVVYGNKKYDSEVILKLHTLNQIIIPLKEYDYESEKFYVEIKFYYNLIKKVLLGYTRIER